MNNPSNYFRFTTKSGALVQLFIAEENVLAKLDDTDIGPIHESEQHGYSLKAKYSVKKKDKYLDYTIVPEPSDAVQIRRFFIRAQKIFNVSLKRKSDEMRKMILRRAESKSFVKS